MAHEHAAEILLQGIVEGFMNGLMQMPPEERTDLLDYVRRTNPEYSPVLEAMLNGKVKTLEDLRYQMQIAELEQMLSSDE